LCFSSEAECEPVFVDFCTEGGDAMLDSVGRLLGVAFHPPGAMLHVQHKTVTTGEFSKQPA